MDAVARPLVARYLVAPAYAELQRQVGRDRALAAMWDAWARGDPDGARRAVPDTVIDELVVWGTPGACAARLEAIRQSSGARVMTMALAPPGATFEEAAESYAPRAHIAT